jgi:hypothetical protein
VAAGVAVAEVRGQFKNLEGRERPPLEDWKPLTREENEDVALLGRIEGNKTEGTARFRPQDNI